MTDLWESKVTIYNDIPATKENQRTFNCFVIDKCQIQGGIAEKTDITVRNKTKSVTVITKDVEHYKAPEEYQNMPENQRTAFFTVQTGDYIVFAEITDTVENAGDFAALQSKYKDNGIKVMAVDVNINGMSVDNITITNG